MALLKSLLRHWLFWTVSVALVAAAVAFHKPLRELREADGCREGGGVWDRAAHACLGAATALKFTCETRGGRWEKSQCVGSSDPAFASCWNLNKIWLADRAECVDRAAFAQRRQ